MGKYDNYFLQVARETALLSDATRLKVGAVATKDRRIVLCGFNGRPSGQNNCCEDSSGHTLLSVIHAEENLVTYASRKGISLEGCSLYCTHAPCINCARLIYGAGFDNLTFLEYYRDSSGLDFLKSVGVSVTQK